MRTDKASRADDRQPNDALHPAIQRLIRLAPRIRTRQQFSLKASGSRVEGSTAPGASGAKTFSAHFAGSVARWTSNDESFWKPVKAVLLHDGPDERGIAQYLSPPSKRGRLRSRFRALPVRVWQNGVAALLFAGAAFAAYAIYFGLAKTPAPHPAKPPEPPAAPQAAMTLEPEPAPAPKLPVTSCYHEGDTVTVRGNASKAAVGQPGTGGEVWVLTTSSPLCVYEDKGGALRTVVSKLQVIGTPPPSGVPLELTGELFTREDNGFAMNHRIRVKQGRRLK